MPTMDPDAETTNVYETGSEEELVEETENEPPPSGENDTFDILASESDSELPLYVIVILAVVGAILITAIVLGGLFLRTRRRATGTYR